MYGSACARTAALTTGSVLAGGGDFGWGFIAPGTLSRLLELKRKIGESLAQFCNAAAVDRARHVDLGMCRHMVSELGLDLVRKRRECALAGLVNLCQNDLVGDPSSVEHAHQRPVDLFDAVT